MINRLIYLFLGFTLVALSPAAFTRPIKDPSITIVPQSGEYLYKKGEAVLLSIRLLDAPPLKDSPEINYRISLNGKEILSEAGLELQDGKGSIRTTSEQPGFLRCDLRCILGRIPSEPPVGLGLV